MSLAAASRDLRRRCVYRYQASRKLDASVDEAVSALAELGAGPNLRNCSPCPRQTSLDCGR
jgi:hypothetical protein